MTQTTLPFPSENEAHLDISTLENWLLSAANTIYTNDNWNRFTYGIAPISSADWGWVQHILASLKENGRAAIVLDIGAVSRGSGSKNTNRERDIRQKFVEENLIEGVILRNLWM